MRSIHRVGLIINSVASGGKRGGLKDFLLNFIIGSVKIIRKVKSYS
jgi:hypothetical protein